MRRPRLHIPDEILLRRFGIVRAVGGAAWFVAVGVLWGIFGRQVWPLALGVPVLAVVTTAFFVRSAQYPRASVAASLAADALVLGGAIAFLGGTGSGLIMLYAIVVVSAGILLGPTAALGFTGLTTALSLLQLLIEQLGYPPVLLHRPDLADRMPVLLVSLAGLTSIGYLSASYAGRLQELIAEAGERAEAVRRRGRRRRSFARQAAIDIRSPLRELEAVAEALDGGWSALGDAERRGLAARLRLGVADLDAEIGQLEDVVTLEPGADSRPEPVHLARVVDDCVTALSERLEAYKVHVDVPPLKVVGDRRAARRVVFNLLANVVEHTPPGTAVRIDALARAGAAVLVVTDDGPGIPADIARRLFSAPDEGGGRKVGLPLVKELCDAMGARIRHEHPKDGGTRFLVSFRLAPASAPTADDTARAAAGDGSGEVRPTGS